MGIKKASSLRKSFWRFLLMLLLGLAGAVAVPFAIMLLTVTLGYTTYADYSTRSAEYIAPIVAATPDLSEVELPAGINFLRLDKNYNILATTLGEADLNRAMEYAISGKANNSPEKQYLLVTRENEYVILQYYVGSQFTNNWLNEHLPSPEKLLYIVIGINCIAVCVILTGRFSKKLRRQLDPLFEATAEISAQNLDFDVGHSKVKEFEDVLQSFSNMKDSLKESLEQQWKLEQMQKEQIAALAHDLKTPLTVIQGNIDLMSETELDDEQKAYTGYITESSEQMQIYIKTLIEISRASAGYQLHKENVDFSLYVDNIKEQIEVLCTAKDIQLTWNTSSDCSTLEIDTMLIERAIMNVVGNAVEYSPINGTVYIKIQYAEKRLHICVVDEGKGFSNEALHHAQEQFFMDDSSRNSKMHFGMGLYIVDSIMKQHSGQLFIANDITTHGAKVIMNIIC
ncbi:Alkaline phosphatase synthesis sensor protein phoR [uncultured Roseburia sp.]|uniref:histidine kinase n=1 Tax=Brotonthovivens ammoniilytica TaxID=2981725 RepID=A0ABT2TIJ5_9FIRM|nr:HAMP domain-containing sensor histidine kinase [Brotonthovivens ammoniilytica]MCU6762049.1 HAMP domain-containing histidine kinase [Brotonthovivens ammoniilytica]SCI54074.1 Alkaline phosphatase synthesis sensor protein phoR [uncultured Roseburia sp.]